MRGVYLVVKWKKHFSFCPLQNKRHYREKTKRTNNNITTLQKSKTKINYTIIISYINIWKNRLSLCKWWSSSSQKKHIVLAITIIICLVVSICNSYVYYDDDDLSFFSFYYWPGMMMIIIYTWYENKPERDRKKL